MPWAPKQHKPRIPEGIRQHNPPRAKTADRLYGWRWQKASKAFLEGQCCKTCWGGYGLVRDATVTDHIEPHRGNLVLFWDRANWQPLCKPCHDAKTGRGE